MMFEFLKVQLEEVDKELKENFEARRLAGVSNEGEYDIKINKLKRERNKLLQELEEEEKKYKTPEQLKIYFYVIVSTEEKVRQNIGDNFFSLFEKDRYHTTELNQWKPFSKALPIKDLLMSIEKSYNIKTNYLDGDINADQWIELNDEINNSIAIIDLFSISEENKAVAAKFDTDKAGVIFPVCRYLDHALYDIVDRKKGDFKVLSAKVQKYIPCELYATGLSDVDSFIQHLLRIFKQKFPIKNQSTTDSLVRGLNTGFQ